VIKAQWFVSLPLIGWNKYRKNPFYSGEYEETQPDACRD
jgi:hypothetical protein